VLPSFRVGAARLIMSGYKKASASFLITIQTSSRDDHQRRPCAGQIDGRVICPAEGLVTRTTITR
jgi:hypothetical protein